MRRRVKGQNRQFNVSRPKAVWDTDPLAPIRGELAEMERAERESNARAIPQVKVLTKEEARAMALRELNRRY